ncbi:MAG TPA: hypothetical protein V6D19_13595 [Stenomitos sp.]
MLIPLSVLNCFLERGLVVSDKPFVAQHIAFPNGHVIGKPRSVPGNCIPGYECYWSDRKIVLDAPTVFLHREGSEWVVTVHEHIPSPGPGDFVNRHATSEDAITDILDYFFGAPMRMASGRRTG